MRLSVGMHLIGITLLTLLGLACISLTDSLFPSGAALGRLVRADLLDGVARNEP